MPKTSGPPRVAMIGGGQLARMTDQAAIALGQTLRVLAGSLDDPAAQVSCGADTVVLTSGHLTVDAADDVCATLDCDPNEDRRLGS